jgi:anti-anti-sigma factor
MKEETMATFRSPRAFYGHLEQSPILALKGQIRYLEARVLRSFIDDLLRRDKEDNVIIDLRELEAIDSTGLGLLAHVGRTTLARGRRSVIVCSVRDIVTCLRSVAFDTMFLILEAWPFAGEANLAEVPLELHALPAEVMARVMIEAHRDLAELSERNRRAFAAVISALEADLENMPRSNLQ